MTVKNEAVVSTVKRHKEPLFRLIKRTDIPIWKKWVIRIATFAVAAITAGLLFTFIIGDGAAFGTFFKELWSGSFGTERLTYIFLNNWAIMMCISLAVTPAFKMRFWNIGAEGQTLAAALGAAFVIHYFGKTLIEPVVILLMLVAALFMGILWALIPAIFKAIWGTNETLFTLMMNYVAIQLVSFFVNLWSPGGSGTIGNLGKGSFHGLFGLPYIQNAVFVAHDQDRGGLRVFQVIRQMFLPCHILCFAHYYDLPFRHHGKSFGCIDHFVCRRFCAIIHCEIEIFFFFLQGCIHDKLTHLVYIIILFAHQEIYGRIDAVLQVAYNLFVSDFFCHFRRFTSQISGVSRSSFHR